MQALSRTARNVGLVGGLLLSFFVLVSLQVNRAQTLGLARGAVFGVASPFQRLASATVSGVRSVWSGYIGLVGAAREARQLRSEVQRLRRRLQDVEEIRRRNERLAGLLGIAPALRRDAVAARVAARDFAHRYETVTLDRGSADGVRVDAPVLAPDGALVGRIVQVARWTSLAQLITDPLSGVGARLAESRATGLLAGVDRSRLELRYVDSLTQIGDQELVVTSGEDGIYPPGLPIGVVSSHTFGPAVPGTPRIPLAHEEGALFKQVIVRPFADVLRLEDVLVLAPRASS